jgi:hypothetical protein
VSLFEERMYFRCFCDAPVRPADVAKCRDLFAVFLVKVGSVSLCETDVAEFCRFLTVGHTTESILKMLSLLLEMHHFLSVEIDPDAICGLMCGNVDAHVKIRHVVDLDACAELVARTAN